MCNLLAGNMAILCEVLEQQINAICDVGTAGQRYLQSSSRDLSCLQKADC